MERAGPLGAGGNLPAPSAGIPALVLEDLTEGRVETHPVTIPEGLTLPAIAGRLVGPTGLDSVTVLEQLQGDSLHIEWGLPGPGLEGYLLPETYRFAEGVSTEHVISAMVRLYRNHWTPERRARLEEIGLSEREAVTLASIVQAEARMVSEMPTIASVYHNRLDIGMLLQADPTVLYALGGPRARLLYAAIDSVADNRTTPTPTLVFRPGRSALQAPTLWMPR